MLWTAEGILWKRHSRSLRQGCWYCHQASRVALPGIHFRLELRQSRGATLRRGRRLVRRPLGLRFPCLSRHEHHSATRKAERAQQTACSLTVDGRLCCLPRPARATSPFWLSPMSIDRLALTRCRLSPAAAGSKTVLASRAVYTYSYVPSGASHASIRLPPELPAQTRPAS